MSNRVIECASRAGRDFSEFMKGEKGKMSRRQPELVNGFVPLATETGQWLYFAPSDVKRVQFTPVPAEQAEPPAEQTTE